MDNRILAKYIFDEANEEERAAVEQWLSENPERGEELKQLTERLDLAARRYRPDTFVPDTRIFHRKSRRVQRLMRYAAVAVVVLVAGLWLLLHEVPGKDVMLVCRADETREFYLPDSSVVTLSGASKLVYTPRYGKRFRKVSLKGKAFFSVRKDLEKSFIVQTSTINVKVLGTAFQVQADASAAEVMVERGRVKVTTSRGKQECILQKGMSASYKTSEPELKVSPEFDANRIGWKTGVFRFKDAPLAEVIRELNLYYQVKMALPDEYDSSRITVSFDKLPLKEALEIINQTLDIELVLPAATGTSAAE